MQQLPQVQLPEHGTDSASRDRVGKTVTLQGNLDPCALYASEVTTRSLCLYVCEFVSLHFHGCDMAVFITVCASLYYLFSSPPLLHSHPVNSRKAGISVY